MQTIKNFFDAIWGFITSFFGWFVDVLLWVPKQLFAQFGDAIVAVVQAIPVPGFVSNVGGLFSAIPSSVWWFASVGEFKFGLSVIGLALGLRFVIRRLPVIG